MMKKYLGSVFCMMTFILLVLSCTKSENPLGLDDPGFLNGTWENEKGTYTIHFYDSIWWSGLNEGVLQVEEDNGTLLIYGQEYAQLTLRDGVLEVFIVPTQEVYILHRSSQDIINLDSLSSLTRRGNYIAFASNRLGHSEGDVFIYTVDQNAYLDTIYYVVLALDTVRVVDYDTTSNGIDSVVSLIIDTTLINRHVEPIRSLTNRAGLDVMPAWSPDGKRLAFVSDRSGKQSIWIYFLDNLGNPVDTSIGNPVQLTNGVAGGADANPTWSPDGSLVAFERRDTENSADTLRDIYIISSENYGEISPASNFTHSAEDDIFNPEWAPRFDIDVILFERRSNGSSSDWDVFWQYGNDSAGFVDSRKVTNPNRNGHPTWSPNGKRVAWERNPPGNEDQYDIQIQNVDFSLSNPSVNNSPTPLTNQNELPGLNRYPTWLPNGNLIAFMRENDIWLIDITSGVENPVYRRLLEDGYLKWDIAW